MFYLESALVVGVPLVANPVSDRIDHVYLQKVGRSRIRVVKSLLLTRGKHTNLNKANKKFHDLKVMYSEMDEAEIGLIRNSFIKERDREK
jgi:hypothetical protein